MSRYVLVEMPMPRGCAECPLKAFGGACRIPVFGNEVNYKPFEERPDWCPIKGEIQDNSIISISEGQIGYPVMQRDPRDFLNGRITGISNVKL